VDRLVGAVAAKFAEQVDRTVHLIGLAPADCSAWIPPIPGARPLGELLGHLLDCLAGVCAVLYAAHPEALAHFAELRTLPVNFNCEPDEARERIGRYGAHIQEGFAVLRDDDLARKLPTVFVPEGEPVLTLLLGNMEHLINHKHQLFLYLKMLPLNVGTPDLYYLRAAGTETAGIS
jgi:hypothetical protein